MRTMAKQPPTNSLGKSKRSPNQKHNFPHCSQNAKTHCSQKTTLSHKTAVSQSAETHSTTRFVNLVMHTTCTMIVQSPTNCFKPDQRATTPKPRYPHCTTMAKAIDRTKATPSRKPSSKPSFRPSKRDPFRLSHAKL